MATAMPTPLTQASQRPVLSPYIGLVWRSGRSPWLVQFRYGHKEVKYVGMFKDDLTAAAAYDRAALRLLGNDTPLNFPSRLQQYIADDYLLQRQPAPSHRAGTRKRMPVSGFFGVTFNGSKRWTAMHGKQRLGSFVTPEDAARAFDASIRRGALGCTPRGRASMNFPEEYHFTEPPNLHESRCWEISAAVIGVTANPPQAVTTAPLPRTHAAALPLANVTAAAGAAIKQEVVMTSSAVDAAPGAPAPCLAGSVVAVADVDETAVPAVDPTRRKRRVEHELPLQTSTGIVTAGVKEEAAEIDDSSDPQPDELTRRKKKNKVKAELSAGVVLAFPTVHSKELFGAATAVAEGAGPPRTQGTQEKKEKKKKQRDTAGRDDAAAVEGVVVVAPDLEGAARHKKRSKKHRQDSAGAYVGGPLRAVLAVGGAQLDGAADGAAPAPAMMDAMRPRSEQKRQQVKDGHAGVDIVSVRATAPGSGAAGGSTAQAEVDEAARRARKEKRKRYEVEEAGLRLFVAAVPARLDTCAAAAAAKASAAAAAAAAAREAYAAATAAATASAADADDAAVVANIGRHVVTGAMRPADAAALTGCWKLVASYDEMRAKEAADRDSGMAERKKKSLKQRVRLLREQQALLSELLPAVPAQ